jgi:hypothetical protein
MLRAKHRITLSREPSDELFSTLWSMRKSQRPKLARDMVGLTFGTREEQGCQDENENEER